MIFLLALIPATMLSIAGLVALFLSHRSEGALRIVGRYLGYWAFTLAVLVILGSVVAAGHARGMRSVRGMSPRINPMAVPNAPALRGPAPGTPAIPETPSPAPQR